MLFYYKIKVKRVSFPNSSETIHSSWRDLGSPSSHSFRLSRRRVLRLQDYLICRYFVPSFIFSFISLHISLTLKTNQALPSFLFFLFFPFLSLTVSFSLRSSQKRLHHYEVDSELRVPCSYFLSSMLLAPRSFSICTGRLTFFWSHDHSSLVPPLTMFHFNLYVLVPLSVGELLVTFLVEMIQPLYKRNVKNCNVTWFYEFSFLRLKLFIYMRCKYV